jgi:hypothetical protein
MRSPADEGQGITARDKLRRNRTRGGLLMEDRDQDVTNYKKVQRDVLRDRNTAELRVTAQGGGKVRVGGQGSAPNQATNRDVQTGAHSVQPQDTDTGVVGQAPSDRDGDADGGVFAQGESAPEVKADAVPMSDGEVQSAVHKLLWDAIEYVDQELSPFRALATKYYQGEPFGNEQEGRSKVVLTELRDGVLYVMPSLMRMFTGPKGAVEYGPTNKTQVQMAKDATNYVNKVVLEVDNRWFLTLWSWFKDALVKRLGVVKCWYDDTVDTRAYESTGLSAQAVILLQQDEEVRTDEVRRSALSTPGQPLFDVEFTRTRRQGKIRLIPLPPEEYLFTRGARTVADDHSQPGVALMVAHRTELTRSQLLAIGVDEDTIEEWAFKDVSLDMNQEEIARQHIVKPDTSAIGPIATQKALYIESYPFMDVDGDGIAELRKIVTLGPAYHVIENEPCARRPFAVICPDPEPHTIVGQGFSDYTMDLQLVMSSIARAMNDSLALSINPRLGYVDGDANLEDIMATEIGAPIRARSPGSVWAIEHNFVGREALAVLDFYRDVKERRTGVSKDMAAMDAGSLQSTTRTAAIAAITAAQAHIESIARIFAEMGVAPLFRLIIELLVENQAPARMARLSNGEYAEYDPRSWQTGLDVVVNVAIGGGLDEQKYETMADLATRMEQAFGQLGLNQPVFSPKNYRDVLVEMLRLRGRMDAEAYVQDVPANWQPPPQPTGDPNMLIAQGEKAKADAKVQQMAQETQLKMEKQQADSAAKVHALEIQLQKMAADHALDQRQIAMDFQLEVSKLAATVEMQRLQIEATSQLQIRQQDLQADIQREKHSLEAGINAGTNAATDGKGTKTVRVVIAHEKPE